MEESKQNEKIEKEVSYHHSYHRHNQTNNYFQDHKQITRPTKERCITKQGKKVNELSKKGKKLIFFFARVPKT